MKTESLMVGWAHSHFGKSAKPDIESLIREVGYAALEHAGIAVEDVDFATIGTFNGGFSKQGFAAALIGVAMPELRYVPSIRAENACATGTAALYSAIDFVESGRGKIALVIGAEKMTSTPITEVGEILLSACYRPQESTVEGAFAGVFAKIANAYFAENGDRSKEMAMIAAKNHANAMGNPYAHMHKALNLEFCNQISDKNPFVAKPLRRTDCSLISDGAAAIVVCDRDTARGLNRAIGFRARANCNDIFPLSMRDMTAFEGARRTWSLAKEMAGINLDDLSLIETHDCFTIAEMIEYEAMGLTERGQGWRAIAEGWTQKDGKLPINPSGGLKAKGHPIGATGVSMHVMAAMQLMGEAGDMQIANANLAGVFNMGGAAVSNYVSILERVN